MIIQLKDKENIVSSPQAVYEILRTLLDAEDTVVFVLSGLSFLLICSILFILMEYK